MITTIFQGFDLCSLPPSLPLSFGQVCTVLVSYSCNSWLLIRLMFLDFRILHMNSEMLCAST